MKLILLAAPGAGKGTQAEKLSKYFNIPTISTGAILRKNIKEGTELGTVAKSFIDKGMLVPDDVIIGIVEDRLKGGDCKNGFILDGFPRTLAQAEALDKSDISIDRVITIEVDDQKIIERLSGRLECKNCGTTFHKIYRIPKTPGVCDICGGELVTRADDKPDTVKKRLNIYHEQTEPLKDYYKNQGKLAIAYSQERIEDTTVEVLNAVKS